MNTPISSMNASLEKKSPKSNPEELQKKLAELQSHTNPEEKLRLTIDLMESALSQEGHPCFKTFWDARECSLQLFKENIPPAVRAIHWQKYRDLTQQARILKEHFEEESSFAVEQIEMALQALEQEIAKRSELLKNVNLEHFPLHCKAMQQHLERYQDIQCELTLLNASASRINSLRKELATTKMRVRKKSSFFDRLSKAGNQVFPIRKALIEEVSNLFSADIDGYINANFTPKLGEKPLHPYREEIKLLQAAAKQLSINSQTFSQTRLKLSECWDKLKELEKEHKKFFAEKKEVTKKNTEELQGKIQEVIEQSTAETLTVYEAQSRLDEISRNMRDVELARDDVIFLKDMLIQARKPLLEKLKEEEKKKRQKELEKEETRQEQIRSLEEAIATLIQQSKNLPSKELFEALNSTKAQITAITLSDYEKETLIRSLLPIEDVAYGKQDDDFELPSAPDEAKKVLKDALSFKLQRRALIKDQIDKYRKLCGSSGLDFEQSMHYNQQLALEKDRYDNISEELTKLEAKIAKYNKK